MKGLIVGALAALLCVGGGFGLEYHRDHVAGVARAAHADSLVAAAQRITDSLRAHAAADSTDAASANARASAAEAVAESYRQVANVAAGAARVALARLDSLHTSADSLADYRDRIVPPLLASNASLGAANDSLASAVTSVSSAYQAQLRATAALESITRGDSTLIRALRDSLGKPIAQPITRNFGAKLLNTGETAGVGLATVYACSHGASVGCIAGALTTLIRAKPWKL